MTDYKIHCINLERRPDRKIKMEEIFRDENITDYSFFKAIDGRTIASDNKLLNLFKHYNSSNRRVGAVGAALSHYTLWNNLINDTVEYYLILEDDVTLGSIHMAKSNFNDNVKKIISQMSDTVGFVYLGYILAERLKKLYHHLYYDNNSYTVHKMEKTYVGGFHGYIISKKMAQSLINYISKKGIKEILII